jgi:hypothetical protein
MRTLVRVAVGALVVIGLVACPATGDGAGAGTVNSVAILGGDRTRPLDDSTITLGADVQVAGTISTTVAWTSSTSSVATIDAGGALTTHAVGTTTITATSTADTTKSDTITVTVREPGELVWTRQFGTGARDEGTGVAADASGNVYVVGATSGALYGSNLGNADAFIRSYDRTGTFRWEEQFGTGSWDSALGAATDASGNVYVVGYMTPAGSYQAFLRSYDSAGILRWTDAFGAGSLTQGRGVATDASGNVYIVGDTDGELHGDTEGGQDVFVRSYDSEGGLRWSHQFGTSSGDFGYGVATDASGNVYIVGTTDDAFESFTNAGHEDVFVRSYDSSGEYRWTVQFGTDGEDEGNAIAVDSSGNVYVVGAVEGVLEGVLEGTTAGGGYVRSYDSDGVFRWTHQFRSSSSSRDSASGVTTDESGNVFVTGYTYDGDYSSASLRSYDSNGTLRWERQFDAVDGSWGAGVAADRSGYVYIAGYTSGAFDRDNLGDLDSFVKKHGP